MPLNKATKVTPSVQPEDEIAQPSQAHFDSSQIYELAKALFIYDFVIRDFCYQLIAYYGVGGAFGDTEKDPIDILKEFLTHYDSGLRTVEIEAFNQALFDLQKSLKREFTEDEVSELMRQTMKGIADKADQTAKELSGNKQENDGMEAFWNFLSPEQKEHTRLPKNQAEQFQVYNRQVGHFQQKNELIAHVALSTESNNLFIVDEENSVREHATALLPVNSEQCFVSYDHFIEAVQQHEIRTGESPILCISFEAIRTIHSNSTLVERLDNLSKLQARGWKIAVLYKSKETVTVDPGFLLKNIKQDFSPDIIVNYAQLLLQKVESCLKSLVDYLRSQSQNSDDLVPYFELIIIKMIVASQSKDYVLSNPGLKPLLDQSPRLPMEFLGAAEFMIAEIETLLGAFIYGEGLERFFVFAIQLLSEHIHMQKYIDEWGSQLKPQDESLPTYTDIWYPIRMRAFQIMEEELFFPSTADWFRGLNKGEVPTLTPQEKMFIDACGQGLRPINYPFSPSNSSENFSCYYDSPLFEQLNAKFFAALPRHYLKNPGFHLSLDKRAIEERNKNNLLLAMHKLFLSRVVPQTSRTACIEDFARIFKVLSHRDYEHITYRTAERKSIDESFEDYEENDFAGGLYAFYRRVLFDLDDASLNITFIEYQVAITDYYQEEVLNKHIDLDELSNEVTREHSHLAVLKALHSYLPRDFKENDESICKRFIIPRSELPPDSESPIRVTRLGPHRRR